MSLVTLALVVLIVVVLAGGFGVDGGTYRNHGFGAAGLLVVILLILLLTGNLR